MGTAFRDIALRLTEASITFEQMTEGELIRLLAEAARTIDELRGEIEELRLATSSTRSGADLGDRPKDGP